MKSIYKYLNKEIFILELFIQRDSDLFIWNVFILQNCCLHIFWEGNFSSIWIHVKIKKTLEKFDNSI